MRFSSFLFIIIFISLILPSCSGLTASTPETPADSVPLNTALAASTNPGPVHLWGMYDVLLDPVNKTAVVQPDRSAQYAVNVVKFLNDDPSSMHIDIAGVHTGTYGTVIYVDVTLIHPFPGMPGFDGYDVRGVLMGTGSGVLAYNPDLIYPNPDIDQSIDGIYTGAADKPDGYTRWFNKPEFSTGGVPMFSYTQGNQAPQDFSPTATLCPYKYFADGLGATDDASEWLKAHPTSYGSFKSGSANTRRYAVRFPPGTQFKFGYAVIASWAGQSPYNHPAMADEAVTAEADVVKDIYYESPSNFGGDLIADFTLYAWKGLPTTIVIESTVFTSNHTLTPAEMTPIATGSNYATWHIEIPADNVQGSDGNEFWVIAEYGDSNYKNNFGTYNLAGDDLLAAAFRFDLPVISDCGLLMWAKKAGGQLTDRGRSMVALSNDKIVVTGEFSQVFPPTELENIPATFGPGEPNETVLVDPKLGDIFVACFNPSDGTLFWAKRAGGTGYDCALGITALSDDSVVITGFYGATSYSGAAGAVFGEGELGETFLEGTSQNGNFFIARYMPDGSLLWAKRAIGEPYYNNENTERGHAVTSLSDDRIIATGVFGNKAIFGENEPNETALYYDPYYWDIFIACYNPDGTLAWARRDGGSELERPLGITALANNDFVITGEFGTQDVKPATFGDGDPNEISLYTVGGDDIFIARYNSGGVLQWAKRAGGVCNDAGYAVAAMSDNTVVVTGSYGNYGDPDEGPATFGPGEPGQVILPHAGWDDIFVARYSTNGSLMWARRAAGESQEIGHGITVLSDNKFAIAGEFWDTITFGEGDPDETTLDTYPNSDPNFVYSDIFVAWYNPDGTISCATSSGGKSYDNAYACTSLPDDSVVASGDFAGTYGATFGGGEANEVTYYGQGIEFFVARYLE